MISASSSKVVCRKLLEVSLIQAWTQQSYLLASTFQFCMTNHFYNLRSTQNIEHPECRHTEASAIDFSSVDIALDYERARPNERRWKNTFRMGGEPASYATTGNSAPNSLPLYRVSPAKREVLGTELDRTLGEDIVDEYGSVLAAPVVLVPKKDGGTRLRVDYHCLNTVTSGSDPLYALRSEYQQVNVVKVDPGKTAVKSERLPPIIVKKTPTKVVPRGRRGRPRKKTASPAGLSSSEFDARGGDCNKLIPYDTPLEGDCNYDRQTTHAFGKVLCFGK